MPTTVARQQFIHRASLVTLSLTALAAACATVIAWSAPVRQTMDMVVPPALLVVFLILLVLQIVRPARNGIIMRTALFAAFCALAAPAWFYSLQATRTPGLRLVDIYPPAASPLLLFAVTAMIYLPLRQGALAVLLGWLLVALPVLVYLLSHGQELATPRGADLFMTYGPVFVMLVVMLPVQRGLTGKIRELVAEQARVEAVANRDALTGLYNRRFGELFLQDMLQRGALAGVIMFDMDRFKAINDTYGHPVGDRVLREVAECCQRLLRKSECLTRWGGEEFLVVVPDVDVASLHELAQRVRKAIAGLKIEPVPQTSAAVGTTLLRAGDDMAEVLKRVDQALYRAKDLGGNVVV